MSSCSEELLSKGWEIRHSELRRQVKHSEVCSLQGGMEVVIVIKHYHKLSYDGLQWRPQ